jgi:hypothetical protein
VPESIDSGEFRVPWLGRLFALAAFHHRGDTLDKATLDRIVDRAIALFEAGDVHAARALFYLATPDYVTAARALDELGVPPRRRRPVTGPPTNPGCGIQADRVGDGALYGGLTRLLAAPLQVQALLWEDARRDPEGRLTGVYLPVPVVWPPGMCQHAETICPQCLLSWSEDHALAVFDHGPDGAEAGCLCRTCRPDHSAPSQPPSTLDPAPRRVPGTGPTTFTVPDSGTGAGGSEAHSTGGGGGGWYTRQVAAGGRTVGLRIDAATGLTAVFYPDRPPPRLGTGPHLALLAAVADTVELLAAQPAAESESGRCGRVWR